MAKKFEIKNGQICFSPIVDKNNKCSPDCFGMKITKEPFEPLDCCVCECIAELEYDSKEIYFVGQMSPGYECPAFGLEINKE